MSKRRNQDFEDLELAQLELIELVSRYVAAEDEPQRVASEIVDAILLDRPDLLQRLAYPPSRRVWLIRNDQLSLPDTPWFMRGGDEYGNDTVAVRVPLLGQLIVNTTFPKRSLVEPAGGERLRES